MRRICGSKIALRANWAEQTYKRTAARKRTAQRKIDEKIKRKMLEDPLPLPTTECSSEVASTDSCGSTCTEFEVPKELKSKCQNRYLYDQLAILSNRYRLSSRETAAIVDAALQLARHGAFD